MSRGAHLTDKELEFIKVHSLDMTTTEIAQALGRNYFTIHRQLQKIGAKKNHVFTANDDFVIRKLYGQYNAKYIATKLGIDETAVYNRVKKLGLKKNG